LQVPYEPPAEYELEVEARRIEGTDALGIGLVGSGRQFFVVLDAHGGNVSGLEALDGQGANSNPTKHLGVLLPPQQSVSISCVVHSKGVRVMCAGKTIIDWKGTHDRLSLGEGWAVPNKAQLFLATCGSSFNISKLVLRPLGKGSAVALRPLSAEEAKQQQADEAKRLGVPVQIENSIGMKLNLIPAGRFLMGSPEDEPGRQPNEGPQHEVTISKPFLIGLTEVTQAEYEKVTGTNPSKFNMDNGGGPDHPVGMVSWDDAVAFCKKLSELPEENKAGRVYRLPTEAEWEYACRAGTQTRYSFGDDASKLGDYSWYIQNSQGRSHPVGEKPPNPWGLYDMHGNVPEWCADWYSGDYYKSSPTSNPAGPASGAHRVRRDGGFPHGSDAQRAAFREGHPPSYRGGFRVV
jgi:formylglycine-generating enzyme required for sulfatase activity